MDISEKKLSLIERLMKVRRQVTLEQIEEILIQAELESNAQHSIEAVENGDVVPLEQFAQSNQSWLKKRDTK